MKAGASLASGRTRRSARTRALALRALVLGLAGFAAACGKKEAPPQPAAAPPAAAATPVATVPRLPPRQQLLAAIELLNNGDVAASRVQLMGVLAQRPRDRIALDLVRQIDTDPRTLLGSNNYTYTIRPGETLATISARMLGSSTRFWALARYNNIAVPASAVPGQLIQIPGTVPVPRAVRAAPVAQAAPAQATQAPAAVVDRPAAPRANPAAASRLRSAGLAEMARGSIDKAVILLQRALALNPSDATILGDLTRARRIQGTLRNP